MISVETGDEATVGIPEAAVALRVSTMTIRRMIKRGDLKAIMVNGRTGREWRITLDPHSRETDRGDLTQSKLKSNGAQEIHTSDTVSVLLEVVREHQASAREHQASMRELQAKLERLHEERADLLAMLARYEERLELAKPVSMMGI